MSCHTSDTFRLLGHRLSLAIGNSNESELFEDGMNDILTLQCADGAADESSTFKCSEAITAT